MFFLHGLEKEAGKCAAPSNLFGIARRPTMEMNYRRMVHPLWGLGGWGAAHGQQGLWLHISGQRSCLSSSALPGTGPRTWLVLKKLLTGASKHVDKRDPLCMVGKNVNWCSYYGTSICSMKVLQKIKNITTL